MFTNNSSSISGLWHTHMKLTTSLLMLSMLSNFIPNFSTLAGTYILRGALSSMLTNVSRNTGTTNSFTGVDISNLTGGVFNSQTLLESNNLGCFLYQVSAQGKPDILLGALNQLTGAIGSIIGKLGCPQLQAIDAKQLQKFPGYTKQPVYG